MYLFYSFHWISRFLIFDELPRNPAKSHPLAGELRAKPASSVTETQAREEAASLSLTGYAKSVKSFSQGAEYVKGFVQTAYFEEFNDIDSKFHLPA